VALSNFLWTSDNTHSFCHPFITMKHRLEHLLKQALAELQRNGILTADTVLEVKVERTRDRQHGDFASNVGLLLGKTLHRKPRELAEAIVKSLPSSTLVSKAEVAGPGFINFFLDASAYQQGGPCRWNLFLPTPLDRCT
jgi:arginyl-tRNA synthetase